MHTPELEPPPPYPNVYLLASASAPGYRVSADDALAEAADAVVRDAGSLAKACASVCVASPVAPDSSRTTASAPSFSWNVTLSSWREGGREGEVWS